MISVGSVHKMLKGELGEFINENGIIGPSNSSNFERPLLDENKPQLEMKGDFLILKKSKVLGEEQMAQQLNFKVESTGTPEIITDLKKDKVLGATLYKGPEPETWKKENDIQNVKSETKVLDYWALNYNPSKSGKGEDKGKTVFRAMSSG